jgi:hypothetical protein
MSARSFGVEPRQSVLMFTVGEEALTDEFEVVWTGSCYKVTRKIDEEPAPPSPTNGR